MSVNDDAFRSSEIEMNEAGMPIRRCAGANCGAKIVWAETLSGSRMPFDPEPDRVKGNFGLDDRGSGRIVAEQFTGRNLDSVRYRGTPALYVSHYASCPDAATFRRVR